MAKTVTLDVRELPPYERHPLILETWEKLEVGDEIELINDHDPKPLHYQFMMEYPGEFEWASEEKGRLEWVAHIKRLALPVGDHTGND